MKITPLKGNPGEQVDEGLPAGEGNPDDYEVDLPSGVGGGGFGTYWPLNQNTRARIGQGPGGGYSHDQTYTRNAVDLEVASGTQLRAGFYGVVARVSTGCSVGNTQCGSGYGNYVYLKSSDGTCALLAHMTKVTVSLGQQLKTYDAVGLSGNTGNSSGPHLHYDRVNCSNNQSLPWSPTEGGSLREGTVIVSQNRPGSTNPVGNSSGDTLAVVTGANALYAKQGINPANGGFTEQTKAGDATAIAAGGENIAVVNGAGAGYAKAGIAPAGGGFTQETAAGDAQAIAVGSTGLTAIINGCGAAYAKDAIAPAGGGFTQLTECGDARALSVGGNNIAIINGCGAAYAKSGVGGGFIQQTACGDALAVDVSASGLIAIINGCGAAYAKAGLNPPDGGFTQQTICGDAKSVAVGGGNLAIINGAGAAYAKTGVLPAMGGFTRESADGDAMAVDLSSSGSTLGIINSCGAFYAKEGLLPANGGFTQQTACGDARAIALG